MAHTRVTRQYTPADWARDLAAHNQRMDGEPTPHEVMLVDGIAEVRRGMRSANDYRLQAIPEPSSDFNPAE